MEEGRKQRLLWLTADEQARVKDLLEGKQSDAGAIEQEKKAREKAEREVDDLRNRMFEMQNRLDTLADADAERDRMKATIEEMRRTNSSLSSEIDVVHDDLEEAENTIRDLRAKLAAAEAKGAEKAGNGLKLPDMPERRSLVYKAMTTTREFVSGEEKERDIHDLKAKAELAKKFVTEIKNTNSRLASMVSMAYGQASVEQSKSRSSFSGWVTFKQPIITEAEKSLLLGAESILWRIARAVEHAGEDVERLQKQREAEHKERYRQAVDALNRLLFSGLDRRGEVLFLTVQAAGDHEWKDLVSAAKGHKPLPNWGKTAMETFQSVLQDQKGYLARRVADTMQATGQSADELVQGVVEKYRHPDTEEKHGETASQITMFLVSERLSKGG